MKYAGALRRVLNDGVSNLGLLSAEHLRTLRRAAHLICGVSDYDAYVAHQRAAHPDAPCLDYAAFFRQRQEARYGRGAVRCC